MDTKGSLSLRLRNQFRKSMCFKGFETYCAICFNVLCHVFCTLSVLPCSTNLKGLNITFSFIISLLFLMYKVDDR